MDTKTVNLSTESSVLQMLAKHGPWAFWSGILLAILWIFTLEPMREERALLLETFVKVSVSTEHISEAVRAQKETLTAINKELAGQTDLRLVAMDTMSAFADEMRIVNPGNGLKLDALLKKSDAAVADEEADSLKLDVIIKAIEDLQEETP
jgi:hypothetical protein